VFTLAALVIGLTLLIGVAFFSIRRRGYSQRRDTLSELGEWGAPGWRAVGWGLFLPVGLALWVLATAMAGAPALAPAAGLAACLGIGYVGAALFPCDPGSPLQGSWRQQLHNLAGAVEYVGGAACLYAAGGVFTGPAVLALAGGVGLSVSAVRPVRGLLQRVIETLLFVSLAVLAAQ